MASSINLPVVQGSLLRSQFLGRKNPISNRPQNSSFPVAKQVKTFYAKFDLFEILGGRGLCNGEKGVEIELKRKVEEEEEAKSIATTTDDGSSGSRSTAISVPEDGFEKEMMGLTGGFPGGEKGLKKFIEENPPPLKKPVSDSASVATLVAPTKKPKPPVLPLLMPGMIAIVKNPNNPFYMYCGIVQRITDGKAGVLFEGGNWDRLITFRLDELERREKGPPMKNPKSVALEVMLEKDPK